MGSFPSILGVSLISNTPQISLIHTYIHAYIHTYTYIYVYIYICIYAFPMYVVNLEMDNSPEWVLFNIINGQMISDALWK